MTTPTAESLEAAREWCSKRTYSRPQYPDERLPMRPGEDVIASLAALLDSHSAPLRAEIERLKMDLIHAEADVVDVCLDLQSKEGLLIAVENIVNTYGKTDGLPHDRVFVLGQHAEAAEKEVGMLKAMIQMVRNEKAAAEKRCAELEELNQYLVADRKLTESGR